MLWNHAGTVYDWDVGADLQVELKRRTQLEVGFSEAMERFSGIDFRKRTNSLWFRTGWLKWLAAFGQFSSGREMNFFPAETLQPFLASAMGAEASLSVKPAPHVRLDQTYLFSRLRTRGGVPGVAPDAAIVNNHIWRSRAAYQFTRRLSLRVILDYSAVLPDRTLIDLERDKRFRADALVTYQVDPWTAVYVGYTDAYANARIDPLTRDRIRLTDSPFHPVGRQLFIKTSYLVRF